jgi:hypothetical protein
VPCRDRCSPTCPTHQPAASEDMAPGILTTGTPPSPSPERGSISPQEQSLLDSTADQEWVGRRPSSSSGRETKRVRRSSLPQWFMRCAAAKVQNAELAGMEDPTKAESKFRRAKTHLAAHITPITILPTITVHITPPSSDLVDNYTTLLPCTTITSTYPPLIPLRIASRLSTRTVHQNG